MVMMERFGSPATRWMSVLKSFQVSVRSLQPGDRILVITDDAMDRAHRQREAFARQRKLVGRR